MSANDGGDPIRLGKEPVPKPSILRGDWLFPNRDGHSIGDRITITAGVVTYHDVEVIDLISGDPVMRILPDTVATWDVPTGPN